ncbi:AI-2E family transporter [Lacticaseibacillus chiayiensis]|uniref:AI-2E family transporter n=1 Tax=Lacticaseibacillus chiayiensis TaxID=2100821 RepID=UPI003C757F84
MFDKLRHSKLMFWSVELLVLIFVVIGLTQVSFLFAPVATFFSTLLIPILSAGFLFYLFNPIVKLLQRLHISRNISILLIFLVVIGAIGLIIMAVLPNLIYQVTQFITNIPDFLKGLRSFIGKASHYTWYQRLNIGKYVASLQISPSKLLSQVLGSFSSGLPGMIGSLASIVISIITIPVMLFYFLKDGENFVPSIQRLLPRRYHDEVATVFTRLNATLSHYIGGQAIECLFVGTFTFIGYLIIGMPYAYLLGFIAGLVTIIPYLGPYIGIAPALVIAATQGWTKVLLVVLVVVIIQMTDGNFIYPNVIGRSLDIHPLTIIILLMVASNLWGLMGTILAVPTYAVIKTVITYLYELYRFHQAHKDDEDSDDERELPEPTAQDGVQSDSELKKK